MLCETATTNSERKEMNEQRAMSSRRVSFDQRRRTSDSRRGLSIIDVGPKSGNCKKKCLNANLFDDDEVIFNARASF